MNKNTRYNVQGYPTRTRRIKGSTEQEVRDELIKLSEQSTTVIGLWLDDLFNNEYFKWYMNPEDVTIVKETDGNPETMTTIVVYYADVDVVQIKNGPYLCPDHGYETQCDECMKKYVGDTLTDDDFQL